MPTYLVHQDGVLRCERCKTPCGGVLDGSHPTIEVGTWATLLCNECLDTVRPRKTVEES